MEVKPAQLILRCYAEKSGDQWQAFCLDLCLAAQGDSPVEVREKLHSMIVEYVYDAVVGQDKDFAPQLLFRRAPLRYYAKFYFFVGLYRIGALHEGIRQFFNECLPLEPTVPNSHA